MVGAVLASFPSKPTDQSGGSTNISPGSQKKQPIVSKDVAKRVDSFVSSLGDTLLGTLKEGESVSVDTPSVSVRVSKVAPRPGKSAKVTTSFGDLHLPGGLVENGKAISVKVSIVHFNI